MVILAQVLLPIEEGRAASKSPHSKIWLSQQAVSVDIIPKIQLLEYFPQKQ
jgi:hypothetical protein